MLRTSWAPTLWALNRSKTASAEWSNALVHLGTMADQMGTEKQIASGTAKQKFTRVFFLTTADGKKLDSASCSCGHHYWCSLQVH